VVGEEGEAVGSAHTAHEHGVEDGQHHENVPGQKIIINLFTRNFCMKCVCGCFTYRS
jgi:hypothetical protein